MNKYGTGVVASCHWGNGPDIMLTVAQQQNEQLPPKLSYVDLDVASARRLIAQLERAIQEVDCAEAAFEEYCSRDFEDVAGPENG